MLWVAREVRDLLSSLPGHRVAMYRTVPGPVHVFSQAAGITARHRSLIIQTLRPLRLAHARLWRLLSITREGRGEGARRRRGQDGGKACDGGGWDADPAPCSCQSATGGSGCSNGSRNMAAAARCFGPEREAEPVKEARVVGSELVDTYTVCRGRERHN